jgi:LacI family transcriptional regulator
VAKLAKASQATVSYVLNGNSAISVPKATSQRILTAVDEFGYVPNGIVRSPRTQRTYMIAALVPDITKPFYPAFERGAQEAAEASGYDLVVFNTGGIVEKEQRCVRFLQQGRVGGAVAVFFHPKAEDLRPLPERKVALVRLEPEKKESSSLDTPLDDLCVDNVTASRTAVEHLIGPGHARVGMIAGQSGPRQARVGGYRAPLAAHRLSLDESLIRNGDFSEDEDHRAMQSFLDGSPIPNGRLRRQRGHGDGGPGSHTGGRPRSPGRDRCCGLRGHPCCQNDHSRLNSVAQFQENLGVQAVEMLLERLNGTASEHGRSEEMPYEPIVPESA